MRHHNSVFHGLLKHVPWAAFERLVDEHDADRRVRRLTTKSQLVALLYGQLAGASSLREIEGALASHRVRLYHLGAAAVARSTLADANAARPAAVFAGLLARMVAQASRPLRRRIGEAVRLVEPPRSGSPGRRPSGRGTRPTPAAPSSMSSTTPTPTGRPMPPSRRPGPTTSWPPATCRSRRARPTCSTSAITITPGGRSSTAPAAASSRG